MTKSAIGSTPNAIAVEAAAPPRGIAMNTLMLILAATVLGVLGQMMLKQGMTTMGPLNVSLARVPQILWSMGTAPFVVGGLLVYGSGTFFWLIALSRLDLSYVYPFASLSYVLIFAASWLIFHEQVTMLRVLGMLVICAGVFLVARS